jgi:hypothetical protein
VPTIGFFGAEADQAALLDWLLVNEGLQACEAYSAFDSLLRHFRTPADVTEAFPIGKDAHGSGAAVYLALWKAGLIPAPRARRIALNPGACGDATFRFSAEGHGLIFLQLGGLNDRVITQSVIGQNSEARAEAWGVADGVDWDRASKLWGRIQYHLRKRTAVASASGSPVLPQAYDLVDKQGYQLKQFIQSPHMFAITKRKN